VEAAESSPAAARECAQVIRKFLSKDGFSRPHVQYNGIMLVRILSDNPGPTFTRNLDKKFADTVKELLRLGRDPSVKQILIETLDNFQREKKNDENLAPLIQMWEKEQAKMEKAYGPKVEARIFRCLHFYSTNEFKGARPPPGTLNAPPVDNQNYFSRNHSTNRPLPPPQELSSRIEEARTSAKLLTQLVQSTPPAEFDQNDLIREFGDRCLSASRSIQGYISSQNPAPDDDTMLTLIDTNDQLALAMSKHQRGILQARKALGLNTENGMSSGNHSPNLDAGYTAPPRPPPSFTKYSMPPKKPTPPPAKPSTEDDNIKPERSSTSPNPYATEKPEDPFKDPAGTTMQNAPFPTDQQPPTDQFFDRLGVEPYHPGFNPTQSYMGRQDSAVGKVAMHAAGPPTPAIESEKEVVQHNHIPEEDSYDVSPVQRKAPIYRY
jgi:hypothetical protein